MLVWGPSLEIDIYYQLSYSLVMKQFLLSVLFPFLEHPCFTLNHLYDSYGEQTSLFLAEWKVYSSYLVSNKSKITGIFLCSQTSIMFVHISFFKKYSVLMSGRLALEGSANLVRQKADQFIGIYWHIGHLCLSVAFSVVAVNGLLLSCPYKMSCSSCHCRQHFQGYFKQALQPVFSSHETKLISLDIGQ